ncbi:rod shape-determining protein MreD [Pararhodobacter sp.]|uniref:rod shape-determining protein MreD n=1 Tax=Pararhodobacter sp. TaxID=2127056 RepID=UPI002AFEB6DF|nr:rod shape-determining protein MreD [Pararhodobacter sp.]
MNEFLRWDTLVSLGLWLLIAGLTILIRMLPLSIPEGSLPRPDFLLTLTLAWVLRRPAHLPAIAIVAVFLIEDLFLFRPPGLWALMVLAGTEFLRRRQSVVREMHIFLEWALVSAVIVAMFVGNRLGLVIVMSPRPPLDLSLIQLVFTLASYPLVVWGLQSLLRVRKAATGEVDDLGRKV